MKIIWLGKSKQKFIEDGYKEFTKRISRFAKLKVVELSDVKLSGSNNVEIVKEKEAETILKNLKQTDFVIALDETGKQYSSVNFAKFLDKQMGKGEIVFIIGGVYGLHKSVKQRANLTLSFSQFTFTHQMIRMILTEQIYRAFTIIHGKKYHY